MKPKFHTSARFSTALTVLTGCLIISNASNAGDFTWDGSTSGSWIVGSNWVENPGGAPAMGIDSVQTFHAPGAGNLTTFLGGGRVLGSLDFNDNAESDVSIRLTTTDVGTTASNLTFDTSTGSAAINVSSGAAGNFTLGVSTGNVVLSDNLLINHNGTGILTINRPVTGAGVGLTKAGTGALNLSAANSFNGGFTLSAGTLNLDYGASDTSKLSDSAVLTLAGGAINLNGTGTHLELVGSTRIEAGKTTISRGTGGTARIALGAITRDAYGVLNINADSMATTSTAAVNGILGGWATRFGNFAAKSGSNIVAATTTTLLAAGTSGTANYTTQGAIVLTEDSAINSLRYQNNTTALKSVDLGGFTLTINSGGLILVNNNTNLVTNGVVKGSASGELIVHAIGSTFQRLDAQISNNGGATAFVKAGNAALRLSNSANNYSGPTHVLEGSLTTTASEVIPNASAVTIYSVASLDLGANTETVSSLVLNGGTITGTSAGSLIATSGDFDLRSGTVSARLAGTTGVNKSTTGKLTLLGNNIYSGTTNVSAGTLLVNGTQSGGAAYTVGVDGTLGGNGMIGTNNANVTISGILSPGNSADTLEFALGTGTLDISAADNLVFELGTLSDLARITTGSLTIGSGVLGFSDFTFSNSGGLSSGTYTLFESPVPISGSLDPGDLSGSFGLFTGTLELSGNNLVISVIPEPGTAMLGLLAPLALLRRRRNS